jgi:hypothetical protein
LYLYPVMWKDDPITPFRFSENQSRLMVLMSGLCIDPFGARGANGPGPDPVYIDLGTEELTAFFEERPGAVAGDCARCGRAFNLNELMPDELWTHATGLEPKYGRGTEGAGAAVLERSDLSEAFCPGCVLDLAYERGVFLRYVYAQPTHGAWRVTTREHHGLVRVEGRPTRGSVAKMWRQFRDLWSRD